jgi:hypothetical protein
MLNLTTPFINIKNFAGSETSTSLKFIYAEPEEYEDKQILEQEFKEIELNIGKYFLVRVKFILDRNISIWKKNFSSLFSSDDYKETYWGIFPIIESTKTVMKNHFKVPKLKGNYAYNQLLELTNNSAKILP